MFSIIVPSYNRHAEIPQLLASLTSQTEINFEVIIIDDHSDIAIEITQHYPFPVQIIRNAQNLGAAESRNRGAYAAKNAWLLFLDDDDRFSHEKCEILSRVITENPHINFIYHPAECQMVNEGFRYFTHPYQDEKLLTLENILRANKIGGMPMVAIKTDFFKAVGGFATDLRSLEDYEFILKTLSHPDFCPKYVDTPLTKCTFHTKRDSVSTNIVHTESAIEKIQKKYVKTPLQAHNFSINALYMLAYPCMMKLSRKAAYFYWKIFIKTKNIKFALMAIIIAFSPKLAIHLRRVIS